MDSNTRHTEIVTAREKLVLAEATRRGLTIERIGKVWRIHGRGVDVRAVGLHCIDVHDLQPVD